MIILRQTAKIFALISLLFAITSAQSSVHTLDAGTRIKVRMDVEVNSEVATANDTFTVKTADAIRIGETVLLPAQTVIEGRVVRANEAASGGKPGILEVRFERLMLDGGESRTIDAALVKPLKAESTGKSSILAVIGGTAVGALLGAVTKSGNGALIGAGIGAGAGTGIALSRKGKNVRIRSGEVFEIVLNRDVVLPVKDF